MNTIINILLSIIAALALAAVLIMLPFIALLSYIQNRSLGWKEYLGAYKEFALLCREVYVDDIWGKK